MDEQEVTIMIRPHFMTTPPRMPGRRCHGAGALLFGAFLAGACTPSPVSPAGTAGAANLTSGSASQASADGVLPNAGGHNSSALTPSILLERGWSCRQPPIPNRIICSRPHQGFPVAGNPPPADRPATFTFLAFDGAGAFIGTQLMIRSDLYQWQRCGPSDEPFVLRPPIGYYECVHSGA